MKKGYITKAAPREIRSLMYMFDVPKGLCEVRMVYDGSRSGLNESLWAPWFALPTVDAMVRSLMPGYWCADNDYGEQFLNFNLHKEIRAYCGVDLSQLFPEDVDPVTGMMYGKLTRAAMGLRPSPYGSVKGSLRATRIILGNRFRRDNHFQWESIRKNQPGDEDYLANLPWISKIRKDGLVAAELLQYIDDLRTTAPDDKIVWAASSRIAKACCWLGLQDAARKRREPSQTPGAWAGATVPMDGHNVYKGVTQDRWEKTQRKVRWLAIQAGLKDEIAAQFWSAEEITTQRKGIGEGRMEHKTAESYRGFLVYVSRTYKSMVPYLKGLHLSLDSWRLNRDEDGWRLMGRVRIDEATKGCAIGSKIR
jgi:hypothetical protein